MTTKQQLPLSTNQSPKAGEGSSSLKEVSKIAQSSILKTRLNGLIKNVSEVMRKHTPSTAFNNGIVLQSADRHEPGEIRILLLAQLQKLVSGVNATRSFKTEDDYFDCVEDIIEVFPSLKIEEILLCLKEIRQGKHDLYGTLCTGAIIKSLHAYELANTIPFREQKHKAQEPYINGMIDYKRLSEALTVDQPKRSLEELGGYINVTEQDLKDIEKAKEESK